MKVFLSDLAATEFFQPKELPMQTNQCHQQLQKFLPAISILFRDLSCFDQDSLDPFHLRSQYKLLSCPNCI
jgi:hypothetical protein